MKKLIGKRLLSTMLTGVLAAGSLTIPVWADTSGTIYGESETIQVSSDEDIVRERNFNKDWKFYLGTSSSAQNTNFDDSSWKNISVPYDFSISQKFTSSGEAESGFLPGGTGWYRKKFTLSESYEGKQLVLNFDGAYADSTVYVNGKKLGENHNGYTSFAFDITDEVVCDGKTDNVVAVKVVNNIPSSRWYSGSGIYRDVTLITTGKIHVERYGTQITTPDIASGKGTVNVVTEVKNDSEEDEKITVRTTACTMDGKAASEPAEVVVTVKAGAAADAVTKPSVASPKLWSIDSPNQYIVRTEILKEDTVIDSSEDIFGFRYYSFDNTGFHLNGKNVKLNGVCMHHDQGALGAAANYDAMYRQLSIMKDMGVNAIRTSHNPVDEDFIDICNNLGLVVIEELFDGLVDAKNGNSNDFARYFNQTIGSTELLGSRSNMTWAEFVAKSIARRDRNDPSVILWSLGNEIQEGTNWANVGSYASIAQNLINWIKEEDTTRPTTSGDNNRGGDSRLAAVLNTIRNNGGVVGFNYANSADQLKNLANQYGGVIIASETASATNSRGIYRSQVNNSDADGKYHLTSYDTSSVSWGIPAHDSIYNTYQNDCVAGEFVWTGFDYIGEPTPWNGTGSGDGGRGAVPNSSYFGIVETTGFEKDTYYLYRSQWNKNANTLHLVTAWDSDNMLVSNGKTPIVIYSNASKIELYRNGDLIGTATRKINKSAASHTYYTYATKSENTSVCTAVSASGADSLYATFNVAYAQGTISAKAYDENGKEIKDYAGNGSVSTPGTVANLKVTTDKTEILADGSSLAYISVDVNDANGVLDTTATNAIDFNLSGNGVIVGVDNGDQATTAKYQQASVLKSAVKANIKAYAGKALVIVRSTEQAGSFTLNASSNGLTGGSVTVNTKVSGSEIEKKGLINYTLVRDYTVKAGTNPVLKTDAKGTMANGAEINGKIAWDVIAEDVYTAAGDHIITGRLTFDGLEPMGITARLHVIGNVIAMRNISTVTTPNTIPTLPDKVVGVLADAALSSEFSVVWDNMTAEQFANVNDVVMVNGTATVMGSTTLPVTASVRVAEAVNTESENIAAQADSLTEDCAAISDNLETIRDGKTAYSDNTSYRWTNWNNRYTSDTAAITFTWATAHRLSGVNLYFFTDNQSASLPADVKFEYSLNGTDFAEIGYKDVTPAEGFKKTEYVFNEVIDPVALRITLTQQGGTSSGKCVGLTECEIMTYAGKIRVNTSAALSELKTENETAVLEEGKYVYTLSGTIVQAASDVNVNAGVTIIPELDGVVRILTISEDGSDTRTYEVTIDGKPVCSHVNTEVRNKKEATCIAEGYTGDTVCLDCEETVKYGEVVPAAGHITELRNQKTATCAGEGYTGDMVCTVCDAVTEKGTVIAKTEHKWNSGVVTKEPTVEEKGEKTYTCIVCGATKTEEMPKLEPAPIEKTAPKVTLKTSAASDEKICLTGQVEDYGNKDNYYEITEHGFVYIQQARLGTRNLTVDYAGRSKVSVKSFKADGSYVYNMSPVNGNTKYTIRAFLAYKDTKGNTMYSYSKPITVTYNGLK